MIVPGSVNPLLLASDGAATTPCGGSIPTPSYVIKNSLRFRKSASCNLLRTPAAAGNQTTWTWNGWVKLGELSNTFCLFEGVAAYADGAKATYLWIDNDNINFKTDPMQISTDFKLSSSQVFRDPSAWYNFTIVLDTTNATASERARMYVNGVRITTLSTANYPSPSYAGGVNAAGGHMIGRFYNSAGVAGPTGGQNLYADGYIADYRFIDGQALDATSFGEFDSNNVWRPKAYSGGAMTGNSFWLKFDDAAQIGKDSSGLGNHWTANNIDVAAPGTQATYDLMKDSPVMFDDGTANPPGNYATLNPINNSATLSSGNLSTVDTATKIGSNAVGTIGVSSGKYYWEVTQTGGGGPGGGKTCEFGVLSAASSSNYLTTSPDSVTSAYTYYGFNGYKYNSTVGSAYGATYATGDVIGFALDMDAGTLTCYKNGVSQGVMVTGLSGTYFPYAGNGNPNSYVQFAFNFGQKPFAAATNAPPTGFKALCTTNLPYCDPFVKPDGTAPHNATITVAANEFKYLGYAPTAANGVTWGTQLDKLANGVKAHTAGTYTITNSGERFKTGLAQGNP